jgi:hypothetical protein
MGENTMSGTKAIEDLQNQQHKNKLQGLNSTSHKNTPTAATETNTAIAQQQQ